MKKKVDQVKGDHKLHRPLNFRFGKNSITGPPRAVLLALLIKFGSMVAIIWIIAHYGLPAAVVGALSQLLAGRP